MNELFNGEFESIENLEILNLFPNSHEIKFTLKDLNEFVANFEKFKGTHEPNVKISHSAQQLLLKELFKENNIELKEELPSLGFIKRLKVKGETLLADIDRIPKPLKEKVFGGKMFKTISPEILLNFRNKGEKFLKAISLTNNPSLRHIQDVHMGEHIAYEGDLKILRGKSMEDNDVKVVTHKDLDEKLETFGEKLKSFFKKAPVTDPTKDVPPVKDKTPEGMISMSDFESYKKDQETLFNDLKNQLIQKDNDQKNFSETLEKIKKSATKDSTEAICKSALMDGVPKVVVDFFKPVLMSDIHEEKIELSAMVEGKEVKAEKSLGEYVKSFFEVYPSKLDMSEISETKLKEQGNFEDEETEMSAIDKRATELIATGMNELEALEKAGLEVKTKEVN